ncbi:DUF6325 family protein [Microbacterium sp. M3]|jgi:hypothetical protein|uniref:DUF6325 family protein n=1 Tax=Microbacterium arthrosphaerae TaxID=792652 RepID=A0ABU4H438_9MICO|nr:MULTISPECIES: DUF6325 family protein [Microbacterium]MDW4574104.1 DUF6325 family protein [Microbacterium arthrosphaerae]MDW7607959.1 DUF6325 family protein [Microbacterium sp. M3]
MSEAGLEGSVDEELGPIDYIVVEFPAGESRLTGEAAAELLALVSEGTIRVLDLMFVHKGEDGSIDVDELEDIDDLGDLGVIEATLAEVLAEQDLIDIAAAMEPGSSAAVLVWENTWAAPFAVAVRRNGGQLVASGRIPTQALIASMTNEGE